MCVAPAPVIRNTCWDGGSAQNVSTTWVTIDARDNLQGLTAEHERVGVSLHGGCLYWFLLLCMVFGRISGFAAICTGA